MIIINPILIREIGDSFYCILSAQVGHLRDNVIVICLVKIHQWGHLILCFALAGYHWGHFIAFVHTSGILRGILFGERAPWRALYHIIVNTNLILIKQV